MSKRLLAVTGHWRAPERTARGGIDGLEATLVIEGAGQWLRLGVFYGGAAGSRMAGRHATAWRTRVDDMRGVNARFGRWPHDCLTLVAHARPSQD